jgi:NAD(P)-dependent dehydrogenase (short-subunit alcohol dehydrogenase family)
MNPAANGGADRPLAVVTGAGGGIGSAVAQRLSVDHDVIGHDVRAAARAAVDTAATDPTVVSDLATPAGRATLAQALAGRHFRVLVLAHGLGGTGAFPGLTASYVRAVMAVNFEAVADTVDVLAAHAHPDGATAVVVSSQAGMTGEAEHAAYCASKFAVTGWARAAAPGLAARGVRLRVMAPGCVDTSMLRSAMTAWAEAAGRDPGAVLDSRVAAIPAGRLADPREIAAGIALLASLGTPELVIANQSGGETFTS